MLGALDLSGVLLHHLVHPGGLDFWPVYHSEAKCFQGRAQVMMIAFITIKSSLVPLIEGLCAQI